MIAFTSSFRTVQCEEARHATGMLSAAAHFTQPRATADLPAIRRERGGWWRRRRGRPARWGRPLTTVAIASRAIVGCVTFTAGRGHPNAGPLVCPLAVAAERNLRRRGRRRRRRRRGEGHFHHTAVVSVARLGDIHWAAWGCNAWPATCMPRPTETVARAGGAAARPPTIRRRRWWRRQCGRRRPVAAEVEALAAII